MHICFVECALPSCSKIIISGCNLGKVYRTTAGHPFTRGLGMEMDGQELGTRLDNSA